MGYTLHYVNDALLRRANFSRIDLALLPQTSTPGHSIAFLSQQKI